MKLAARERIHLMWHVAALCYGAAIIRRGTQQWIWQIFPGDCWAGGARYFYNLVKRRSSGICDCATPVKGGVCA